ncbi:NUC169 domain-domain-containing protein, partial [Ostreococcus tauri]
TAEEPRPEDTANKVGDVPVAWYRGERHVGYNQNGLKLLRKRDADNLETLLRRIDDRSSWRVLTDVRHGHHFQLSVDEVKMLRRLNHGLLPVSDELNDVNNEPCVRSTSIFAATDPKRRFVRSKHEARRVLSLVRHLRRTAIASNPVLDPRDPERNFDIWSAELAHEGFNHATIRAAKAARAGNESSYNAPPEYFSGSASTTTTDETKSLRYLIANANFVKECFNRCLDLYLCPRAKKQTIQVDPDSILPQVPEVSNLKPFPRVLSVSYPGHKHHVQSISINDSGDLLCSGCADGTVRIYELATGHCECEFLLDAPVACVSWRSGSEREFAVCSGKTIVILSTRQAAFCSNAMVNDGSVRDLSWCKNDFGSTSVHLACSPTCITWHHKGDYFASVERQSGRLCVHQMSGHTSQSVFSSSRHHIVLSKFHPQKAVIFTATSSHVRVFDVREQKLLYKLKPGNSAINNFSLDQRGETIAVCTSDCRVYLFEEAVSSPLKVIQLQSGSGLATSFHPRLPLFAVAATNGLVHVFHFKVNDLIRDPTIVPLKLLKPRGADNTGVQTCAFHPYQPWLLCA